MPKNHSYRTTDKEKLNGEEEHGKKPRIMTPHLWNLEYNRNHQGMPNYLCIVGILVNTWPNL